MLLYTSVNTTSIGRWSLSESVSVIVVAAEPVPILSREGNICVRFGPVRSWGRGGLGDRVTSLRPRVDLILDDYLGSCSFRRYLTALQNG